MKDSGKAPIKGKMNASGKTAPSAGNKTPQKKKQGGMGAPYFGDKGTPYKKGDRKVTGDQRDMGPNAPKNKKATALKRMQSKGR